MVEKMYAQILKCEEAFGRPRGKEERLACLSWAYEDWRTKKTVKKVVAELAQQRAARAAQTSARASDHSEAPLVLDPRD